MFYVSYMTLYEFQDIVQLQKKMKNIQFSGFEYFLYDPSMIYRKSYMIRVWILRNHTNQSYMTLYDY